MIKPIVSIVVASIRPELWIRLYNNLLTNKLSFEIVFVGPCDAEHVLPDNIRNIKINVKPSQCFHCGILSSRGQYILHIADDQILSEGAIDKLHDKILTCDKEMKFSTGMIETRRIGSKKEYRIKRKNYESMHFFGKNSGSHIAEKLYCPLIPNGSGSFYEKSLYYKLNGIDKSFISSYFDLDFVMRIYEAGGVCLLCEDVFFRELKKKSEISQLCSDIDSLLFYSLWCNLLSKKLKRVSYVKLHDIKKRCVEKGFSMIKSLDEGHLKPITFSKKGIFEIMVKVRKNRKIPLSPYCYHRILDKSQGTNIKSKWD